MISIPWQLAVAVVLGNLLVIAALIMQLGAKADRQVQRENEIVRATRHALERGIKDGHEIYLEMHCLQKLKQKPDKETKA